MKDFMIFFKGLKGDDWLHLACIVLGLIMMCQASTMLSSGNKIFPWAALVLILAGARNIIKDEASKKKIKVIVDIVFIPAAIFIVYGLYQAFLP